MSTYFYIKLVDFLYIKGYTSVVENHREVREAMPSTVKSRKKVIRFTPNVEDQIQHLADLNGVTFTAMVNLLLTQALKDPKIITK